MAITLVQLVDRFGGHLVGDGSISVTGIAGLDQAGPHHITFLSNPKLRVSVPASRAAALILSSADDAALGATWSRSRIVADNPYAYFAHVAQWFDAERAPPRPAGIHQNALVDPSARVAATASVAAMAVIEADAVIGEGVHIGAGCYIGRGATIGTGSLLHPRVTVQHDCHLGQRCIVHPGAVIGADGFGFANEGGQWVKIPQTGRVMIADDVEIGANTCIDRGALADTVIEQGVKLDNQIQIGHNCHIGAHTAMAGCVGVAGSAIIGKYCTFGGAAMVLGHLTIGDRVHISSGSMVTRSILEPGQYTGFYPIAKNADWEKTAVAVRNLTSMREKIRGLEKTVKSLTENTNE